MAGGGGVGGALSTDQSPRLTDRRSLKECFRLEITGLATYHVWIRELAEISTTGEGLAPAMVSICDLLCVHEAHKMLLHLSAIKYQMLLHL